MAQQRCPRCDTPRLSGGGTLVLVVLLVLALLGVLGSAAAALFGWWLLHSGLPVQPAMGPTELARFAQEWVLLCLGGVVLFGTLAAFAIWNLVRVRRARTTTCQACGQAF